ncbi:MAG: RNA methyltransferase [Nitrospirae bacterium]|nr:RNA methyltransferase [Nitrospirota bacterium]
MMPRWRENIYFTLITPREPGNIGAAARAIKNTGFSNLDLVSPPDNHTEGQDLWLACHATDVLREAAVYDSVDEALKDKALVVGTSRRVGKKRGLFLSLKEGVKEVVKAAGRNRVAILFGREDRGLTNEEVERCGFLMYIPTAADAPSLNLAQAVLLVAYELACQRLETESPRLVPYGEMQLLFEHIRKTLRLLGYIPRGDRDMEERIMRNLRHLLGRSGLTPWEAGMIHGICSRIERVITEGEAIRSKYQGN